MVNRMSISPIKRTYSQRDEEGCFTPPSKRHKPLNCAQCENAPDFASPQTTDSQRKNDPYSTPPQKQDRLPTALSSPALSSPEELRTPMRYHTYEGVVKTPDSQLKRFKVKRLHTLVDQDSIEGPFRELQRCFSTVKKAQKKLSETPDQTVTVGFEAASITVSRDAFHVELGDGQEQTFGVHRSKLKNGRTRARAFPTGGNGVVVLTGAQVADLVTDYRRVDHTVHRKINFEDFVHEHLDE